MRKWQLALTVIFSAIGIGLSGGNQVKAEMAPGIQDNLDPNLKNMRVLPGKENSDVNAVSSQYSSTQGILAKSGVLPAGQTGNPISNTNGSDATVGSPIDIQIGNSTSSGDASRAWFAMNYVDAPSGMNYLNFTSPYNAATFNSSTGRGAVTPKMALSAANLNHPILAENANYDGGVLNVSGNVPIHAVIRNSAYSTDALMQGNWGVMVKVTLPQDVDTISIANAIAWDQAYFYLSITIPNIEYTVNFPLQFDHHVYKDPEDAKSFYLKVKGIPYIINTQTSVIYRQAWFYPRKDADATDMNNNVVVQNGTAKVLTPLSQQTLPDKRKKDYATYKDAWLPMWGFFGPIINSGANPNPNPYTSATGLFNALKPGGGRENDLGGAVIGGILTDLLTKNGFDGNANINFNIDLSKYNGGTTQRYRPLTRNRLFPSPRADGKFNDTTVDSANNFSNATSANNTVKMTMYPSSSLVDPRPNASTNYNYRSIVDNEPRDIQQKENTAGTTPMDFAVIDPAKAKTDQVTYGNYRGAVEFPVIVNASSWNSFIAPADNRKQLPDTNPITYYKTILPDTPPIPTDSDTTPDIAATILNRTAQPSFNTDGVFVNNGETYKGVNPYANLSDKDSGSALNTSPATNIIGAVTPQRYTRAYTYFKFDQNDPKSVGTEVSPQEITSNANVTFQATQRTATNITNGPTSIVNPSNPGSIVDNTTGKTITKLLGNPATDVWQLTGKYAADGTNGIPMLSAPLKLDQTPQLQSSLNQRQTLAISNTDIASGKTYTKSYPQVWSDPNITSSRSDMLTLVTTIGGTSTETSLLEIKQKQDTPATITFNFTTGTGAPTASLNATTGEITVNIPIKSGTNAVQYDLRLKPKALAVATLQSDTGRTTGYWQSDDGGAGHFYLNVAIVTNSVGLQNYFYISAPAWTATTDQFSQRLIDGVSASNTVNVKGQVKNNGSSSLSAIDLLIPSPAGITLPNTLTVNNAAGTATGATYTRITDTLAGYTHYRYSGVNLAAGGVSYYSYTMTVNGNQLPNNDTQLITNAVSGTSAAGFSYLGIANTLTLTKSTGVQLLTVPDLTFANKWNGNTPEPYKLTGSVPSDDVTFTTNPNVPINFTFQYLDSVVNAPNTTWSLTASLSNFVHKDGTDADSGFSDPHSGFVIDFGRGEPANADGVSIKPTAYLTNDGFLEANMTSTSTGYASSTNAVGHNHVANSLISNSTSSTLYTSNSAFENRYKASPFAIQYDMTDAANAGSGTQKPVKLTIPKGDFATIKAGQYQATASYTISNALQ